MAEELSLKTDIPGLLSLVEITVPRWAAEEPVPGEMVDVAELPEKLEEEKLSFQGAGYRYYYQADAIPSSQRYAIKAPSETQIFQSIYDQNGRLIEQRRFDGEALTEIENYRYDNEGRLIERILKDPFDELSEQEIITYDGSGKIRSKRTEYSDGSAVTREYRWTQYICEEITNDGEQDHRKRTTYNAQNQAIEEVGECEDGKFGCGTAWVYEESGKLREVFSIQANGARLQKEVYEYDERGDLTRWSEIDSDGSTIQQKESQYEEGRMTTDVLYERDNETHTTYEYDDEHLIRTFSVSDSSENESVFSYNKRGLIEMTATRSKQREYDSRLFVFSSASTTWRIYQFFDEK